MTNYRVVNGVPSLIGEMDFRLESSVEFDEPGDGSPIGPNWDLNTVITVTYTWGNLAGGASGSLWTGCKDHPDKCHWSNGSGPENEPVFLGPGSVTSRWYFQYTDLALDQTKNLFGNLGSAVLVNTPAGQLIAVDHRENTLWGRCDAFRKNRWSQGCVDDAGAPFVFYDTITNPAVGPVAAHVYDAIRTLPSRWGSSFGFGLARLTDDQAIDNNRAISCAGVVVPPGQSCDEYPMASTYQGGNGAAPDDRSTRVVPKSANDSQGGITSAYYDYYRILDGDGFWVQARLADGSTAW